MRLLTNQLVAEEIAAAAQKHTLAEIADSLADAEAAGAARWAWVAKRLREGRRAELKP